MGHNIPHWEAEGKIPPQRGPQADGEKKLAMQGRCMGTPPTGGSDGGGGDAGGGDLSIPPPEQSHTFY